MPRPDDPYTTGDPPSKGAKTARAARTTGRAAKVTGHAAKVTGVATGRLAQRSVRKARQLTHAHGAGESGMARLLELHAFNTAGDAAVAVALAGTLFFQVPDGEARGQVALFLGLTMLPFAIVAPLIGPFLDRFRRGRRWAIGSTMAIRAFCCWALAGAVATDSVWLFPAALGCLVSSKAYGVTRASAVPRVLPETLTLVKANSRISLTGTAGAAISAPLALGFAQFGAQWALRYAFALFVVATILAILLPTRVDSSEGEEQVALSQLGTGSRRGIPPQLVAALRCNSGLRFLSGFLTLFMAFLLRQYPFPGWEDRYTLLLAMVVGAAGLGNTLGTLLASVLKVVRPQVVVVLVLGIDVAVLVLTTVFYSLPMAVAFGLTVGICQSLGKLSLDALIQGDVTESVRTSVFARSETLLQLSWVAGGCLGILVPLQPARLGLGVAAALLVLWLVWVLRFAATAPRVPRPAAPRAAAAPRDPSYRNPGD
ncbi:MAG: MFS transporter [Actinomycetota bacterium]|nr:MFS transporter [Actinomycetota bacterium]